MGSRRGRPSLRQNGVRSRMDEWSARVLEFLYDYGPHTVDQIASELGVAHDWAYEILSLLKADGSLSVMKQIENRKGFPPRTINYWILREDLLAA